MTDSEQQQKNQRIVNREIYHNVTHWVNFTFDVSRSKDNSEGVPPFTWEDVENEAYTYEEAKKGYMINEDITEDEYEPIYKEVFEWWLVSSWLYDKLKAHNEVVLSDGHLYLWGRCTTGQSIVLDGVISDIQQDTQYGGGINATSTTLE